jgi:translation initiation factor 1
MVKKELPATTPPAALGSLGDLLRERGMSVTTEAAAPPPTTQPPAPAPGGPDLSRASKLIVRRERKGHGGKAVTVVDGLAGSAAALDALARAMRKALGCGSWVEDGRIVLQGDRPDAAAAWLARQGARQVTRGN